MKRRPTRKQHEGNKGLRKCPANEAWWSILSMLRDKAYCLPRQMTVPLVSQMSCNNTGKIISPPILGQTSSSISDNLNDVL